MKNQIPELLVKSLGIITNDYFDLKDFPEIQKKFKLKMDEIFTSITQDLKMSMPLQISLIKSSFIFD